MKEKARTRSNAHQREKKSWHSQPTEYYRAVKIKELKVYTIS